MALLFAMLAVILDNRGKPNVQAVSIVAHHLDNKIVLLTDMNTVTTDSTCEISRDTY